MKNELYKLWLRFVIPDGLTDEAFPYPASYYYYLITAGRQPVPLRCEWCAHQSGHYSLRINGNTFFYPEIKTTRELNWKELFNFRNLIYIHSSLLFSFENQPPSYPNPMIWSTSSTYINKLSRLLIYSELIHTHFNSQHCTWASHVRDWNLCRFHMWLLAEWSCCHPPMSRERTSKLFRFPLEEKNLYMSDINGIKRTLMTLITSVLVRMF